VFTETISVAQRGGLPAYEAMDRGNRAVVWAMRGELSKARAELLRQLEVLRAQGEQTVNVQLNLADIDLGRGDLVTAARWAEQAIVELRPFLTESALGMEALM